MLGGSGSGGFPNVEPGIASTVLLVDYAARKDATVILRGIRAISDYEFELADGSDESAARGRISRRFFFDGWRSLLLYQFPGW